MQKKNESQTLLIGGGNTNTAFVNTNLIDEIWVSIHPVLLGSGTKMFEGNSNAIKLDKYFEKDIGDGVVHVMYKLLKFKQ